jgi:hypothetical protein
MWFHLSHPVSWFEQFHRGDVRSTTWFVRFAFGRSRIRCALHEQTDARSNYLPALYPLARCQGFRRAPAIRLTTGW